MERAIRVSVSGSFKRHLHAIGDAVQEIREAGGFVLSPSDPRVVDSFGEFLFVASDLRRSIKGIQSRHLSAIENSAFLWLVCPDGYVGQSAAMEIGFAVARDVPIYCDAPPSDLTIRQYVTAGKTIPSAIRHASQEQPPDRHEEASQLLLAPDESIHVVVRHLEGMRSHLLNDRSYRHDDPVEAGAREVRRVLRLPGMR